MLLYSSGSYKMSTFVTFSNFGVVAVSGKLEWLHGSTDKKLHSKMPVYMQLVSRKIMMVDSYMHV